MKRTLLFILLLLGCAWNGHTQIPPVPDPPRLVNDFAGLFSEEQKQALEARLVAFNDSTSNVICVVCVSSLGDYTAQEFAYEIGDQWGVKDDKYNNGVVILIKPKNESSGEVAIQVGYTLEGVIPDACAKRIIENEMIPHFKENDYYGGAVAAVDVICPLAAGEISEKEVAASNDGDGFIGFVLFVIVLIFAVTLIKMGKGKGGGNNGNGGDKNDAAKAAFWAALLSSSADKQRHSGNSLGGFGGSGFGGGFGGGGFGGFGGRGGFGGGGASGRW